MITRKRLLVDFTLEKAFISAKRLIPADKKILIAVSGGSDSVALLALLGKLKDRLKISTLGVAHVNHGLRGKESDDEEKYVKKLCSSLNVPLHTHTLSEKKINDKGLEEWARHERYSFFSDLKKVHAYDLVATGHTLDDQAETVLFRIIRGTGISGLRGIHSERDDGIIRPLLDFSHKELRDWLSAKKIQFCEDSSNTDVSLSRNYLRHGIIPRLRRVNPRAMEHLAALAHNMQRLYDDLLPRYTQWYTQFCSYTNRTLFIDKKIVELSGALFGDALTHYLKNIGIRVDTVHIRSIEEHLFSTGSCIKLPGGYTCLIDRTKLRIGKKMAEPTELWEAKPISIPASVTIAEAKISIKACVITTKPTVFDASNTKIWVDADCVGSDLILRPITPNDRFIPLGGKDRVTCLEFLKKQHIPPAARAHYPCLARLDGSIIWIPGVQVAHEYRITESTQRILYCTLTNCEL